MSLYLTTVASWSNGVIDWAHGSWPDPIVHFTNCAKENTFSVPESDFLVTAGHYHVISLGEETDGARVESKILLISDWLCLFSSLDWVHGEFLVPRSSHEQVVRGLKFLWAESKCPDRVLALVDSHKLSSSFILYKNHTVEQSNSQNLPIRWPITNAAFIGCLCLINTLSIRHPQAKINGCTWSKCLKYWVETESLDFVVVSIFQQSLPLWWPNNNGVVCTSRSKSLTVLRVGDTIDGILVPFDLVLELSS